MLHFGSGKIDRVHDRGNQQEESSGATKWPLLCEKKGGTSRGGWHMPTGLRESTPHVVGLLHAASAEGGEDKEEELVVGEKKSEFLAETGVKVGEGV